MYVVNSSLILVKKYIADNIGFSFLNSFKSANSLTCSPINKTALPCLEIVSIKKVVLTLSTLGTRMDEYSGVESDG